MGKVIDVDFRPSDRGRWCVRCEEPFPEGTVLCPRCGGELRSAARHRAAMRARARRASRRLVGLFLLLAALWVLLVLGLGQAHGKERSRPPKVVKTHADRKVERKPEPTTLATATEPAPPSPRAVRVSLLDGSTIIGTVHAEEAEALVIDCSLGMLSIPRERISTIAYDGAAGLGPKRAPVQQLDDDDRPLSDGGASP